VGEKGTRLEWSVGSRCRADERKDSLYSLGSVAVSLEVITLDFAASSITSRNTKQSKQQNRASVDKTAILDHNGAQFLSLTGRKRVP
jgi:hypothetical protein